MADAGYLLSPECPVKQRRQHLSAYTTRMTAQPQKDPSNDKRC
ncbi:hypothetical protein [Leptolyngbya sp. FACHB-321]|nr:hypothetical protein [Leptolyngbya sp. FACHB-321]